MREEWQQEETALLREVRHHDGPLCDGDTVALAHSVLRFDLSAVSAADAGSDVEDDGLADDLVLVIREDHSIGPHGRVSESSIAMASWICAQYDRMFKSETQHDHPRLMRILELGSGCGLPGLVLAALGATVTLSDQKGALANLTHNVQLNAHLFQGRTPPSVVRLDWRKPTAMVPYWPVSAAAIAPLRSFDFVVAAEVISGDDSEDPVAPHIINTINAWLRVPSEVDITSGQSPAADGGGTFFLLQRRQGANLDGFVKALSVADGERTEAEELGRGLVLDEVELELGESSAGAPLRLYQVRCSADSAKMQRRKPAHLSLGPALERMITSDTVWHTVGFGCSGAAVYRLDRPPELVPWAYLKVAPAGSLAADAAAMQWLERGGVTTARVLHYDCGTARDIMLMSPLTGVAGIDPLALARPHALTTHFARALRALHDNPRLLPAATDSVAELRFDMRLAARLAAKERAARAGTFDPERVIAIKRHLANAPADVERDTIVFTHGDYCLPNVVFRVSADDDNADDDDGTLEVVGLIDVGQAGVADPYRDLASAVWSLRFNGLGDHVEQFLRVYAGASYDSIDRAKLDWYIVMQELT